MTNTIIANSGAKSPKRGRSGSKKGKTPEPEPEPEPELPPGTPPPQPGSDEWEYVDQPIDEVGHITLIAFNNFIYLEQIFCVNKNKFQSICSQVNINKNINRPHSTFHG